jgi:hypothetical protein
MAKISKICKIEKARDFVNTDVMQMLKSKQGDVLFASTTIVWYNITKMKA